MAADTEVRSAYEVLQVTPQAHQTVIRAAYRALAALYHPDPATIPGAQRRMADLNAAYAQIGTPEQRAIYDHFHRSAMRALPDTDRRPAVAAGVPAKPLSAPGVLDFGRYAGWSIADLARTDPDYLRWLARHSSGIRYRREIEDRLRAMDGRERLRATGPGPLDVNAGKRR